jgi:hypothetical protein
VALTALDIRERLGLGEDAAPWLEELEAVGAPPDGVRLPADDEAAVLLERLGVPREHAREAAAALPRPARDPELWWLLERCCHLLLRAMGNFDPMHPWPSLPPQTGAPGRYCYVGVFLAALPAVRRWRQEHAIPDAIAWATLADLGQHMGIYRRINGAGGLSAQNWLTLHFRGAIFRLGRLQFNRARVRYDAAELAQAGAPFRPGDYALDVHIPEDGGPLTPEACDASFDAAPGFFARCFPDEPYRFATCGSWLLDEQLAEYLPPTSNIIRFQRRFHLLPGGRPCDGEIVHFVFRRTLTDPADLPQRTTLERAIVSHLRAGRHWLARRGWLALPDGER